MGITFKRPMKKSFTFYFDDAFNNLISRFGGEGSFIFSSSLKLSGTGKEEYLFVWPYLDIIILVYKLGTKCVSPLKIFVKKCLVSWTSAPTVARRAIIQDANDTYSVQK